MGDIMFTHTLNRALAASALALAASSACAAHAGPHWGYGGEAGPAHWAAMEPEFKACGLGHEQSPIDIQSDAAQKATLPAIEFAYKPSPLKIIDNGHSIQVNVAPGSSISVGGHRYELVQFHFHKPSEEAINGKRSDMVAHLVHRDSEGHLAVVAVLLEQGAINPMVATLWNNLPSHKEVETSPAGVTIDAAQLLPASHAYYTFNGSLTTPPCSEGVMWFVLKNPATLSTSEIDRFARVYPMNARPVQPLNGRVIKTSD
jgi:carbonic anhydrase